MEFMMNKAGCHPPHWKTHMDLPVCTNASQMESHPISKARESFGLPCKMIDRLDFSYQEHDFASRS